MFWVKKFQKHIAAALFAVVIGFVALASACGAVAGMVGGLALALIAFHMANSKTPAPDMPHKPSKVLKRAINFTALLFVAAILTSCASSGVVRNATPILTSKPVSLDFVYVETSSSLSDLDPEKAVLNQSIITGLKQKEIFGVVSGKWEEVSTGTGLRIKIEIKEIKKVSDDARVWAGALAGRARILIHVTVSDLNAGNQIEAFEVEGNSGKSSSAGTTNEAIQQAANQVVVELVKISMQTSQ